MLICMMMITMISNITANRNEKKLKEIKILQVEIGVRYFVWWTVSKSGDRQRSTEARHRQEPTVTARGREARWSGAAVRCARTWQWGWRAAARRRRRSACRARGRGGACASPRSCNFSLPRARAPPPRRAACRRPEPCWPRGALYPGRQTRHSTELMKPKQN